MASGVQTHPPTIFGSDLKAFAVDQYDRVLIQHRDDVVPAGRSQEGCMEGTQQLLTLLWKTGYKVLRKKAQICQEKVKYLGFHLYRGSATQPREEAGCLPAPKPDARFKSFLGL